eukprot:4442702-Pyramimonas_sp.AAC.1
MGRSGGYAKVATAKGMVRALSHQQAAGASPRALWGALPKGTPLFVRCLLTDYRKGSCPPPSLLLPTFPPLPSRL